MIYQEKFELSSQNAGYFGEQFDVIFIGTREKPDKRHENFLAKLSNFKGRVISLQTCENAQKLKYRICDFQGKLVDEKSELCLIPDLSKLLKKCDTTSARVCVDITTLQQGILFLLVQLLLREIRPATFFAAYTEPDDYKKKNKEILNEPEEYDLYERIIGSSIAVPGFNKRQGQNEVLLIAQLGFDSQRLQTIYESLKPSHVIPIVGFPSFKPGWNLSAIKMNYLVLKGAECIDMIKPCEAASPFQMVNLLKEEFNRYSNSFDIYIIPLGTRPHCLGTAIFATLYPTVYLIYDFPVEKNYRSENVLKTNLYNLTKYIGV